MMVGNFSIDLYLGELKDKYYCLFGSPMTVRFRSLFAVRTMRAVISGAGMAEKGGRNNSEISPKSVSYTHLTLPTICSV